MNSHGSHFGSYDHDRLFKLSFPLLMNDTEHINLYLDVNLSRKPDSSLVVEVGCRSSVPSWSRAKSWSGAESVSDGSSVSDSSSE